MIPNYTRERGDASDPHDSTTLIATAREWKAAGHTVTPDPDSPVPLSDDRSTILRMQNFAVKLESVREPEFVGEQRLLVTYNGRQWYPTMLAPHEMRMLVAQLVAAFDEPDIAAKAVHWFDTLQKCAILLGLAESDPIPSGVLRAVEGLVEQRQAAEALHVEIANLRAALRNVCDAALPVTNAAYNMGQSHEQWLGIKQHIALLDNVRSQAHELIHSTGASQ